MRLTCPNCAAQYEVPDEVIPESGRDVQCSACGDTWFQLHPSHPDYKPAFDPEAPEEGLEDSADTNDDSAGPELDATDEDEAPTPEPQRRELSEDVTSVLKEEAERETRARETDMAGGLETQPDLGLPEDEEVAKRTREAKARMARLRGFDDAQFDDASEEPVSDLVQQPDPDGEDTVPDPDIDLGTRANLLPEVEEVDHKIGTQSEDATNASSARDGSRIATQVEGKSGFARGMRLSLILAIVATGLYLAAPQISQMVPAVEAPLGSYTQLVDQGRAALQGLIGQ